MPGPGTYVPVKSDFAPSRSFGRAHRDVSYIRSNSVPGPGAYAQISNAEAGPAFTLTGRYGGCFAEHSRSVSPSPTTYTVLPRTMTPRWTFSSSKRKGIEKGNSTSNVPGPGQYELGYPELLLKKAPSFSIKTRHPCKPNSGSGSCGTYYTQFGE